MQIQISNTSDGPQASLVDPLDFKGFSVSIDSDLDLEAVRSLDGVLRLESDEQAWVSAAWLVAQEPYADPSARKGLDGMIDYAKQHGWLDDEGTEIAAHLERH